MKHRAGGEIINLALFYEIKKTINNLESSLSGMYLE